MALGEDTGGAVIEKRIDGDHDVDVDMIVQVNNYSEELGKEAPHADIPCVNMHSSFNENPQPSFVIPKPQARSSESLVDNVDIEADQTPSPALATSKPKGKPYSTDNDEATASSLMEIALTRPCELVVDVDETGVDHNLLSGETTLAASTAADNNEGMRVRSHMEEDCFDVDALVDYSTTARTIVTTNDLTLAALGATCSADDIGVVGSSLAGRKCIAADDVLVNNSTAECQMITSSVSAPSEVTSSVPNRSSCLDSQSLDTSSARSFIQSLADMERRKSRMSADGLAAISVAVNPSTDDNFSGDTEAFLRSLGLDEFVMKESSGHSMSPERTGKRAEDTDSLSWMSLADDASASPVAANEPMDALTDTKWRASQSDTVTVIQLDPKSVVQPYSATEKREDKMAAKFDRKSSINVSKLTTNDPAEQKIRSTRERKIRFPDVEQFTRLLDMFELRKFYPGKLTVEKVREYTLCSPSEEKAAPFAVLRFFYRLMHNHVDALPELLNDSFNSADVLMTLVLIADDLLRREIFSKMAMLQYALPVCIKIFNRPEPLIFNWSLRSVVKRWTISGKEKPNFTEDDMHSGEFVYASFVRAGDLAFSKSKILNKLFPRENAPYQNKEDDDIPRELSDGCIELSWLFPTKSDAWQPVAITNLRGNATEHLDLLKLLQGSSSQVFVFISQDPSDTELVLSALEPVKQSVVLILPKKLNDFSWEEALKKRYKFIQENEARLPAKIKEAILSPGGTSGKVTFSAFEKSGKNLGFAFEDEKELIRKGRMMAEAVLKANKSKRDKLKLPLQAEKWTEYSELHKEQLRVKKKPNKMAVNDYCVQIRKQKESIRLAQSRILPPQHFTVFAQCLCSKPTERKFFICWLEYFLDKRSRSRTGEDSPGIEHFMREIAQLYEVDQIKGETRGRSSLFRVLENYCGKLDPRTCLRNTVVEMLLEGHPIELLDGDAQGIPEVWMRDIMVSLGSRLDKTKRIGVVSVLGVQSSGKSTLLNAMFGCKFTVSSGRCTRGVNMQVIKVSKQFREICETDYVLILDSEGLKSPEKQDQAGSTEHDSELGTLVVGLSDVVIINVASESMDALKDVIQITIHAFIRMKGTNKQKTKCFFVHQNTGDPSAYEKLANERKLFEKTLQELTDVAARMEFPDTKEKLNFRTILDYGRENSHEYFPGLYNGTPPMAVLNSGYAEKVMSVKDRILRSLKDGMRLTPEEFSQRVFDIWTAVLKEDFIFSFKNSLIASKRSDLDDKIAAWEWECRTEMKEFFEGLQTEILNDSETPTFSKYSRKVRDIHKEKLHELTVTVEEYLKQDPLAHQYFLEEAKSSVSTFVIRAEDEMTQGLKDFIKSEESMREVDGMQVKLEQLIQTKITALVEEFKRKDKELTPEEADQAFDVLWEQELEKLHGHRLHRLSELDIDAEIQYLLMDFLPPQDIKIVKDLLSKEDRLSVYAQREVEVERDHYNYVPSVGERVTGAVSYAKSVISGKSSGHYLALQESHYEPVKAFVRDILIRFETWILATTKSRKLIPENVSHFIRHIFKELSDGMKRYPLKGLYLTKDLRIKMVVRIAGFMVGALEDFRTDYLEQKDPILKLQRQKDHFRNLFLALCASRSLSFAAAGKFIGDCLIPGALESVRISMDRILASQFKGENEDLRNRKTCEIALFKHLKSRGDFFLYLDVIHQFKPAITKWLRTRMDDYYRQGCGCDLCSPLGRSVFEHLLFDRMESSVLLVRNMLALIVERGQQNGSPTFREVLKSVSASTVRKLVLRMDVLEPFADSTDGFEFAENTLKIIDEPSTWSSIGAIGQVYTELAEGAIGFLVESLIGCGNSCPFCGAPCALNSSQHAEHTAEFHRPQIIAGYSYEGSDDAMLETCPAYISSGGKSFKNPDTGWRFVSFKSYKTIYPTWNIPPDTTLESSMFWKWVIVTRASEFALFYGFNEESLPQTWRAITWEMVNQELTQMLQGAGEEEEEPQD